MLQFLCQKCDFLNYTVTKGKDKIHLISWNMIKHTHQNVYIIVTFLKLQWHGFIIKYN